MRQVGIGYVGPIPIMDLMEYLTWRGVTDPDEVEDQVKLVEELDEIFLNHMKKQLETQQDGHRRS